MASVSSPSSLRRKPTRLTALICCALMVFTLSASMVPVRLKNLREHKSLDGLYASIPSRLRDFTWKQNNSTNVHRFLTEQLPVFYRYHKSIFALRSGYYPATHPSRPYYVMIDEAGSYVQTIEDGHEDHPFSRLVDMREPRDGGHEAIFFFVVPKANGDKMKTIMTNCYNLRRTEKREDPESLTFVGGVLNIDTQTLKGLANARSNEIADSGLVDVFATSYFLEGALLFKPNHKGRAFTILQHPVLRAGNLYHSRDSSLKRVHISQYLESPNYIDNWVVRSLTNDKTGELTESHLLVAKGILARKFFLGIAEHFEETIKRLEIYYEWEPSSEGCVKEYLNNQHVQEEEISHTIEHGSSDWNLVAAKDKYDLMLYYYALELFVKQGSTMFNRPYVDKTGRPIDFAELKRKERLKNKLLGLIGN